MSYKKDLEEAKIFKDCQNAYEKECERKYKLYLKKYGEGDAFTWMIAKNYEIWIKAQMRLRDLGLDGDIMSKY